jgi:hypothetical protein
MSEKLEGAIEEVEGQIRELESKVLEHKKAVNILCGLMGREPKYSIEVREDVNTTVAVSGDAYYGKETSEVIADILRRRKRANKGPATVADIFEAMKEGGFHFEASNDANRKRGIYISLGKNPLFHKLPTGAYGLAEWYPAAKVKSTNASRRKEGADEVDELPEVKEEFGEASTASAEHKRLALKG